MDAFLRALFGQGDGGATVGAPALPIDRAVAGGRAAANVAGAFVAGYQAAMRALVPDLPPDATACLCATEEGGAHPRAIRTRLSEGRLSGRKQWVTGGTKADVLLVVASVGEGDAGRNRLVLVRVDARAPGVALDPMPPTPFVPEVEHAVVTFADVAVGERDVLPGDGYERYLKPFRTIEDVHVNGAVLAWILGVGARSGWSERPMEKIAAALVAARGLAQADPSSPATHVALAGLLAIGRDLLVETRGEWAKVDEGVRKGWERDAPLLEIAERARGQRREKAWTTLARGPAPAGVQRLD